MHCKFRADLVLSKEANYSGFRRRHVVLWPVNVGGWVGEHCRIQSNKLQNKMHRKQHYFKTVCQEIVASYCT